MLLSDAARRIGISRRVEIPVLARQVYGTQNSILWFACRRWALLATVLVAPIAAIHAQTWGQYGVTVFALPSPSGVGAQHPINNTGQVAGENASGVATIFNAVSGTTTPLGTLGGTSSAASEMNSAGQIVGYSWMPGGAAYHAFLYSGATMQDLGTFGGAYSGALGINNVGQVVGYATVAGGNAHAFLYDGSTMQDLGSLGGVYSGAYSEAFGINNTGQIVGTSSTPTAHHAFLYSGSTMQDLGTLGGDVSEGNGINNTGQIVGISSTTGDAAYHAFVYSGSTMQDLGTFGGSFNDALGISDLGQAVGYTTTIAGVFEAALWENSGAAYSLFSLASIVNAQTSSSGWQFTEANGISDDGHFIEANGCYTDAGGVASCGNYVIRANDAPTAGAIGAPEPASLALMATGLLGLAGAARIRRRQASRATVQ